MSVLSPAQIASYARRAGFTGNALIIAIACALAESGGNTLAHNPVPPDDSYGLWQINMIGRLGPDRRGQYGLRENADLFDPSTNARAAFSISNHGTNFVPWSTYTNGSYKAHLAAAKAGAATVSSVVPPGNIPPVSARIGRVLCLATPQMRGADVTAVQRRVGCNPDGDFGPVTRDHVVSFQKRWWPNDSAQWDGRVGPLTTKALGLVWVG